MERFTISLDDKLAREFDAWMARRGYENRSEAFRDMLRVEVARERAEADPQGLCVACLSYVFNHHERDLAERLTHLQHDHHELTVSTMHAHLDHELCIETVLLRGPTAVVRQFANAVCAQRGVHHGALNLISLALDHSHPHRHPHPHPHPHP